MIKYHVFDNYYLSIHKDIEETKYFIKIRNEYIFSSDYHEDYYPLDKDFGPINIYFISKFCNFLNNILNNDKLKNNNRDIVYYIYDTVDKIDLMNATLLSACYMLIYLNIKPEEIIFKISHLLNLHPCYYHDCVSKFGGYYSSITDCIRAIYHSININIYYIYTFDYKDYEYCTDFKLRDINIIANKFIAMCCPSNKNIENVKNELLNRGVNTIIRLNGDTYDKKLFNDNNIKVKDLYFDDYTCPSIYIIKKFLNIVSKIKDDKLIAIHCHAGLGRTGVLICIWLILKLNFKPCEAIAYIRIIRPGSIMGSQGFFLESIEYLKEII